MTHRLFSPLHFFMAVLLAFPCISDGQSLAEVQEALTGLRSVNQLDAFYDQHPEWTIVDKRLVDADSAEFPEVFRANVGEILLKNDNPKRPHYAVKILSEEREELCRVKYIYLNGRELSTSRIDSLREVIIAKYKSGVAFGTLVTTYTMDGNETGDLGWFKKGVMVDAYDTAVRRRKKGEIFTVDVPDLNWYYVVLKTHANRIEKTRTCVWVRYWK